MTTEKAVRRMGLPISWYYGKKTSKSKWFLKKNILVYNGGLVMVTYI